MEALYECTCISRQGFHASVQRQAAHRSQERAIVKAVGEERARHPRMGARPLYVRFQSQGQLLPLLEKTGRDRFEAILPDNGLRLRIIRNYRRTTFSGATRFPNLVAGLEIRELNHVWWSGITYYQIGERWAYVAVIEEAYSRRSLACHFSLSLKAEETVIPAIRMALKVRGIKHFEKLVFHSDGGGQYLDKNFLKILARRHIESGMAGPV